MKKEFTFTYKDISDRKRKNLAILNYIRRKGPLSRTDISKETGEQFLHPPTHRRTDQTPALDEIIISFIYITEPRGFPVSREPNLIFTSFTFPRSKSFFVFK